MKKNNMLRKFTSYVLSLSTVSIPLYCQPFFVNASNFHSKNVAQKRTDFADVYGRLMNNVKELVKKLDTLSKMMASMKIEKIAPYGKIVSLSRTLANAMLSLYREISFLDAKINQLINTVQTEYPALYNNISQELKAEIARTSQLTKDIQGTLPFMFVRLFDYKPEPNPAS